MHNCCLVKVRIIGGVNIRKYLGWVTVGIVIITYAVLQYGVGRFEGNLGINIMIAGAVLAVITALMSKKSKGKTVALTILGVLIGGFAIIVSSLIIFGGF